MLNDFLKRIGITTPQQRRLEEMREDYLDRMEELEQRTERYEAWLSGNGDYEPDEGETLFEQRAERKWLETRQRVWDLEDAINEMERPRWFLLQALFSSLDLTLQLMVYVWDQMHPLLRWIVDPIGMFLEARQAKPRRLKLARPPGTILFAIVKFWFSKKAVEKVFQDVVAEMREEYFEAITAGEKWKSRWIVVRGNAALMLSAIAYVAVTVGKKIKGIWTTVT